MLTAIDRLQEVTAELTPKIEKVLTSGAIAEHLNTTGIPPALALRSGTCEVASRVLGQVLQETQGLQYEIERANHLVMLPGNQSPARRVHTRLVTKDKKYAIDPTYGQFVNLVGASSYVMTHHEDLWQLYPQPSIAVFERERPEEYITNLAQAAFHFDTLPEAPLGLPRGKLLRDSSYDDMHNAFSIIMRPGSYRWASRLMSPDILPALNDAVDRVLAL